MKRNINTLSLILGLLILLGLTACPSPTDPAQSANITVTPTSLNLSAKVNQQSSSSFTILTSARTLNHKFT